MAFNVTHGLEVDSGDPVPIDESFKALHQYIAALMAGEELIGDRFLSIQRVTHDWKWIEFDGIGTTETIVAAEPVRLGKIVITGGTTGAIIVRNADSTGGGSAGLTFADAAAINDAESIRLDIGYTIEFGTGTGKILVMYREAEFA